MSPIPAEAARFKPETRERVRTALACLLETPEMRASKKRIKVSALVEAQGGGDRNATTTLLRLWRRGELSVADSWADEVVSTVRRASGAGADDSETVAAVKAQLEGARDPGALSEVCRQIAMLALDGEVSEKLAGVVASLVTESRRGMIDHQKVAEPEEDPSTLLMVTPLAMEVAGAVDLIVCDERRQRLVEHVEAELRADMESAPNEDSGGGAA